MTGRGFFLRHSTVVTCAVGSLTSGTPTWSSVHTCEPKRRHFIPSHQPLTPSRQSDELFPLSRRLRLPPPSTGHGFKVALHMDNDVFLYLYPLDRPSELDLSLPPSCFLLTPFGAPLGWYPSELKLYLHICSSYII